MSSYPGSNAAAPVSEDLFPLPFLDRDTELRYGSAVAGENDRLATLGSTYELGKAGLGCGLVRRSYLTILGLDFEEKPIPDDRFSRSGWRSIG